MRLRVITAIAALALVSACSDPDVETAGALRAYGFSEPEIVGSFEATVLYCDRHDDWGREFRAVGPTGVPVHGVVCGGLIGKGATVRLLP